MNIRSFSLSLLALGLIVTGSGCAKYKPHPLTMPTSIAQEKKDVMVCAKAMNERDCRKAFSRRLLSKGYQPVQLMIQNKSKFTYILDAANIQLQVEPADDVAKKLHLNTAGRVISWASPALFLWPFIIPATVEGLKSSGANKRLDHDFAERVISDDSRIFIAPGSIMHRVMFIRQENYRQSFGLDLFSKEHDELLNFEIKI